MFSFGTANVGKVTSSERDFCTLFLFFSKDPKMDNSTGELGTEAKLTILSLSLEVFFLFHCPLRQMTDPCGVSQVGSVGSVNASTMNLILRSPPDSRSKLTEKLQL